MYGPSHKPEPDRGLVQDAEYATLRGQRAHRTASLLALSVWVVMALERNDLGNALKILSPFILPMACIWFPEELAGYKDRGLTRWLSRSFPVDEESSPFALRWAGWFLLVGVPAVILSMMAGPAGG